MILALAGNQNSGKTTLFNRLTGANQHVGNFPGVTVERKSGIVRGYKGVTAVDLPGVYSLRPYSPEEKAARDFILNAAPDAIINIVDATNIERNLYLTLQLIELGKPMVIALNMMDAVRGNGGRIAAKRLSEELGVTVVPISAAKREGLDQLMAAAVSAAAGKRLPKRLDFCGGACLRCIHSIAGTVESRAAIANIPSRFAAARLAEGDGPMEKALALNAGELGAVSRAAALMEHETGLDRSAALADMRYSFIEEICARTVKKPVYSKGQERSIRADRLLTHKILALPVFFIIMFFVFFMTFAVIGVPLSNLLGGGISALALGIDRALADFGLNPALRSLLTDGVFSGVGTVLGFLPVVLTLFFFLSVMEDSGYMARVAFVTDKLLRGIGLSGRSFVPMLIGFGCTVPAVMAARTIPTERERKMAILLTPFMSCSAKLPIYAVFTAAFFRQNRAAVMILLYIFGMAAGLLCGAALNKFTPRENLSPFMIELPGYRMPSVKSVLMLMRDKAWDFIRRACTVILLASVVIWFLGSFNYQFVMVEDSAFSLLGTLGRFIAPLFAPLGFGEWRAATALITGFAAKEAVVSTLAVLTGNAVSALPDALGGIFTPPAALGFLVFTLLYTPCIAAVAAMRRELGSAVSAARVVLLQCVIAWAAAFIVYRIAMMFFV
ncbi:MAG: ferrous iron transport protein B [Oscillospiraceae bacterium]|nr:ferrous iron transport protein B [Oscillospiraceae bacterium]